MPDSAGSVRTSLYIWPILSILIIVVFKRIILGYPPPILYEFVTDCFILSIGFFLSLQRETIKWQRIQNMCALLFIVYHWGDACTLLSIHARLTLDNLIGNYLYPEVILYFLSPKLIILTVGVLLIPIVFFGKKITIGLKPSTTGLLSYEIIFILFLTYLTMSNVEMTEGEILRVGDYSMTAMRVNDETLQKVDWKYVNLTQQIEDWFEGKLWGSQGSEKKGKPNIVLIMSESLSGVDSKYAGGLYDRLPNIDKIQQDGIAMQGAISNGKIGAHGLASTILGQQALTTGGHSSMLTQFPAKKMEGNNIIAYAKARGYKTIMISAGQPGNWQGLSKWFETVGFDEVYDRDSPAFADAPRFTWDSPSDESMYRLAEALMSEEKGPYLLVIQTVSLLQPYILPDVKYKLGDDDLLNLINYVDQTTYEFYTALEEKSFFKNGVMLLYGDHRRFAAFSKEENENGGRAKWDERIIGTIVGKGISAGQLYKAPFSLIDVNALLHFIVDGTQVDKNILTRANLGSRLGIGINFVATLTDGMDGEYLIRSQEYPSMYLSVFGKVPFEDIPNEAYKEVSVYLVKNDELANQRLSE